MIMGVQVRMENVRIGDSLGLTSKHKSLIMSYFSFGLAYCLSIVAALLVGGVGKLVPVDTVWFQIDENLFIQSSDLAIRVFISLLPLIVLVNLNFIWFKRFFASKTLTALDVFVQTVLGTIIALPFLIFAVGMMIVSSELTWGLWEVFPAYTVIFFVVPLLYMLALTVIATSRKTQVLTRNLSNPHLWVTYFLISFILLFPVAAVILPFFRGYWTAIPLGEILDCFLRAFSISLVLPALPYTFSHFSSKTESSFN